MAALIDELIGASQLGEAVAELAARVSASVVRLHGPHGGTGSGVVWNDHGLIVTNHHVAPGEGAEVVLPDRRRLIARVTARDPSLDLAALQVEGRLPESLVSATIGDSSRLRPGQLVVAVGNPLGERNAVTLGVVAGAVPGEGSGEPGTPIRIGITLRPGNSGGALADVGGRVVGIPHMVIGAGLALAIPSQTVEQFLLQQDSEDGAFFGLGIRWAQVPASLAARYRLPSRLGILLVTVLDGSPAAGAGLMMGDVVVSSRLEYDVKQRLTHPLFHLRRATPGIPVRLTVLRGGQLLQFDVVPEARAPSG
jgi:S1-C subfamily serine protease